MIFPFALQRVNKGSFLGPAEDCYGALLASHSGTDTISIEHFLTSQNLNLYVLSLKHIVLCFLKLK